MVQVTIQKHSKQRKVLFSRASFESMESQQRFEKKETYDPIRSQG